MQQQLLRIANRAAAADAARLGARKPIHLIDYGQYYFHAHIRRRRRRGANKACSERLTRLAVAVVSAALKSEESPLRTVTAERDRGGASLHAKHRRSMTAENEEASRKLTGKPRSNSVFGIRSSSRMWGPERDFFRGIYIH